MASAMCERKPPRPLAFPALFKSRGYGAAVLRVLDQAKGSELVCRTCWHEPAGMTPSLLQSAATREPRAGSVAFPCCEEREIAGEPKRPAESFPRRLGGGCHPPRPRRRACARRAVFARLGARGGARSRRQALRCAERRAAGRAENTYLR